MISILAAISVFLALFFMAIVLLRWSGDERPVERRLRGHRPDQRLPHSSGQAPMLRRAPSSIPAFADRLSGSAWARRVDLELARAGLHLRVGEYVLLRFFLAAAGLVVPLVITGATIVGLIIGLALGMVGFMAPALYVAGRTRRRRQAIERQLAETLMHIANAMRAGFALLQAVDSAARRLQPPMAEELDRLVTDVNLGRSLEDALVDLGERVDSYDLDMIITAILIQRRSGGNLSEVLDNVAETIRERDRVRGEIKTLTAQQRFAGGVLSVWPIVVGLFFVLLNPEIMSNLWSTSAGLGLLIGAVVLQVLGLLTIRRIVAIDY